MEKRLFRSENDRMIAGVCGGLGKEYNIDPAVVRLIFVLATLMGFGLPVIIYIVMALIVEKE